MVYAASKKYHRDFIIFSNEDSGYEEGKRPSGHLMIEVRDRKAKLAVVIQNLRKSSGRSGYALYLMRTGEGGVEYVRAGEFRHSGSRAELDLIFDQGYIGGTIYTIDDFDTFAVLAESDNEPGINVVCPLAAYRNGRTDWRNGFRKAVRKKAVVEDAGYSQSKQTAKNLPQFEPSEQKEPDTQQSEHIGMWGATEAKTQQPESMKTAGDLDMNDPETVADDANATETQSETPYNEEQSNQNMSDVAPLDNVEQSNQNMSDVEPLDNEEQSNQDVSDVKTQNNVEQSNQNVSDVEPLTEHGKADIESDAQTANKAEDKQQVQQPPGTEYKYPGNMGSLNTECVYLNGNICGAVLNNRNAASPCGSCSINRHDASGLSEIQEEGDLNGLEEELDKSFDTCDPFHSRRTDYIWWRVTNPVNLNNMFYQNNIRSPLMFNPAVMMAHYKYKHLIVGVFTHKNGQRYIICGVPGMYMVDSKPFGDMSKWVQAEGSRQRYGAFGYWLIYINPKDGRIISF
ncbi:MAG: hypothetical protein GX279_13170 [Clostridiaceae bacterium]|nr:hypothetical protein [Clostridiaceae bacterium]